MPVDYDHIVLGCGGIGSAAAYWLGKTGTGTVLAIEQYQLGHDRGASEDHSRIIRHSYHSPTYTALTRAAYDHWRHVEQETGLSLVQVTGGLDVAMAGGTGESEINDCAYALAAQGYPYEILDGAQLRSRWPQWTVGDDVIGLYQEEGGILDIRKANAAHVALARDHGVSFLMDSPVRRIVSHDDHVEVHTDHEVFRGASLTVCVGSWTSTVLGYLDISLPITLTQEQVTYFATQNLREFAPNRFPVWIFHGADKTFFGFPVYGEAAVKAARDMSGRFITQEERSWDPDPEQRDEVVEFLAAYLPSALGPELMSKKCVHDMPPDRDFILGPLPGHPRVTVFVGAGHAAKFASLIGRILADLASTGETSYPISAFRVDRPALTDPDYPSDFRLTVPL
ncbi:MAG TPA: N-methyl-L-tryptophan oxidase [Pseudonocardiaceae bacterium]|nr:N-methyl-L-tryptophan oxidase [Pseudonocardiaceae bacterium]